MSAKIKLPRCPGFKYGPTVHCFDTFADGMMYRVQQKGFWQDSSVCGPYKTTESAAIAAWKRMLRKMRSAP